MQCVVNLGDIVDGKCSDVEKRGGGGKEGETVQEETKTNGSSAGHMATLWSAYPNMACLLRLGNFGSRHVGAYT